LPLRGQVHGGNTWTASEFTRSAVLFTARRAP